MAYTPLNLDQPSAFEEVLRYLGRPAYAVRNVLSGNLGGALRQGADLVGDTVDAFLPGDLIPELSTKEDSPEFSDLLEKWGAGKMEPGLAKTGVDILGGIATDPLTFTGTSLFTTPLRAAGSAVRSGVSKIPMGVDTLSMLDKGTSELGTFGRSLIGAERLSPEAQKAIEALQNTSDVTGEVSAAGAREALSSLRNKDELESFGRIMQNIGPDDKPLVESIPNTARATMTPDVLKKMTPYQSPGDVLTAEDAYKAVSKPSQVEDVPSLMQQLGREPQRGAAADPSLFNVTPTEAKSTNGVDIVNKALISDTPLSRIKGSTPLGPLVRGTVNVPEDFGSLFNKNLNTVSSPGSTPDSVSSMLGAQGIPRVSREGIDVVKNPGEAGAYLSGLSKTVPEMMSVAPDDMEKILFTNRGARDEVLGNINKRIDASGLDPEQAARFRDTAAKYVDLKHQQWQDRIRSGVVSVGPGEDVARNFADYMPRMLQEENDVGKLFPREGSGNASSTALTREYVTPEAYNKAIQASGRTPEYNIAKVEGKYAQQQGSLMGRAEFAKVLTAPHLASAEQKIAAAGKSIENWTHMSDAERQGLTGLTTGEKAALDAKGGSLFGMDGSGSLSKAIPKIIEEIGQTDRESAQALANAWSGLPGRGGFEKALAGVNNRFKPFATAGAFLPRINFNVRNIASGLPQVLSNPQARSQWPKYARESAGMLWGAVNDGIEHILGRRIAGENMFADMNAAIRGANGSLERAANALPPGPMPEALRNGVVTGTFADSELLAKEIAQHGWNKTYTDLRDWPAKIAQGAEMRMRYSVFEGLLNDGMKPAEAAKVVKDTFFSYKYNSVANRRARDIIPFFQFTAKAIPQTVKAMKEHPFLIPATRPLFSEDDASENPLPAWMQKQISIPLGEGENGDPQYLTSLGLPVESLTAIPNPSADVTEFGRQLRQGVVGASSPLIKSAYALTTGIDPYFGTKWGTFDKAPGLARALGADDHSKAAGLYNMAASTGLIQPITSPINTLSGLTDPRDSLGTSLLNTFTGAKIKSVDEQATLRQLLSDYLAGNPDVQGYQSFYQTSKDPENQALLKQLNEIKKAMKARAASAQTLPK